MKKVALSLIALLAAGSFAFADDAAAEKAVKNPVEASLSANGSATLGYDLDNGLFGISNAGEAKLKLTVLPEGTSKKGTGATTGYIEIEKLKVETESASEGATDLSVSVGAVTAKIIAGDLYVKLYSATKPDLSYEGGLDASDDINYYKDRYGVDAGGLGLAGILAVDPLTNNGGIEIGYTLPSVAAFSVGVATAHDYSSTTHVKGGADEKKANNVEIKATVEQKAIDKVTVKAGVILATDNEKAKDKAVGLGAEVAYELALSEGYSVTPLVQFDLKNTADSKAKDTAYAALLGAKFRIPGKWDADSDFSGVFAGLQYSKSDVLKSKPAANASVTFFSEEGKIVPNVALRGGVLLNDVVGDADNTLALAARADVKATDNVKVYGEFSYDTITLIASKDASLFLKAGAEFTGLIPLTTFSVDWDSNDFTNGYTISGTDAKDQKLGAVTFTAKVAY